MPMADSAVMGFSLLALTPVKLISPGRKSRALLSKLMTRVTDRRPQRASQKKDSASAFRLSPALNVRDSVSSGFLAGANRAIYISIDPGPPRHLSLISFRTSRDVAFWPHTSNFHAKMSLRKKNTPHSTKTKFKNQPKCELTGGLAEFFVYQNRRRMFLATDAPEFSERLILWQSIDFSSPLLRPSIGWLIYTQRPGSKRTIVAGSYCAIWFAYNFHLRVGFEGPITTPISKS